MTDLPADKLGFLAFSAILEYVAFVIGVVGSLKLYFKNRYQLVMYPFLFPLFPFFSQLFLLRWNYLVMGLMLATFGRPLLVIMIIWAGYGRVSSFISLLQLFVLASNVIAVQGFLPSSPSFIPVLKVSLAFTELSQWKSAWFVFIGSVFSYICQIALHFVDPMAPVYFL